MTSKKILIIFSFIVLFITVISGTWLILHGDATGSVTTDQLSDRAQEFIDAQQADATSPYRGAALTPVATISANAALRQETPCFSINLPFSVQRVFAREESDCFIEVRLNSPAAKLTISSEPINKPLSEDSHVHMREVTTDRFKPQPFSHRFFPDSKTFVDAQGISFFAVRNGQRIVVAFSETSQLDKIVEESLPKVLDALKFPSETRSPAEKTVQ